MLEGEYVGYILMLGIGFYMGYALSIRALDKMYKEIMSRALDEVHKKYCEALDLMEKKIRKNVEKEYKET